MPKLEEAGGEPDKPLSGTVGGLPGTGTGIVVVRDWGPLKASSLNSNRLERMGRLG